jgi:hypothetical protein
MTDVELRGHYWYHVNGSLMYTERVVIVQSVDGNFVYRTSYRKATPDEEVAYIMRLAAERSYGDEQRRG